MKTRISLRVAILTTFAVFAAITVTVAAKLALLDYVLNGQWLLLTIACPIALYLTVSFTQQRPRSRRAAKHT